MWYKDRSWDSFVKYIKFIRLALVVFFTGILLRVFQVQIVQGYRFSEKSQENYLKKFIIPPKRGDMVSADGRVVATTYISYDLVSQRKPTAGVLKRINLITGVPVPLMERNIRRSRRKREILLTLAKDLKSRALIAMASVLDEFPSLRIIKVPKRFYPFAEPFSHVTGYIGSSRVNAEDESQYSYFGAYHGKSGIEKTYDRYLFGKAGGEIVEVAAYGDIIAVKGRVVPSPGDEVRLTIDSRLQEAAFRAFRGRPGAAVALNPATGAVLLYVSSPGYVPDIKTVAGLMNAPDIPLVDRVIQMKYPPGSTFKIITSAAAFNEHCIDPKETYNCTGVFKYGRREFKCWKKEGHGKMDFMSGFENSCDVYFYNVGLKTGGKNMAKYAGMMGLGLNVFRDIPGQLKASIPSPSWKKRNMRQIWLPGDSINMAIGQGFLWVTPMQMAYVLEGVAEKGIIYSPYMVSSIIAPDGAPVYRAEKEVAKKYRLEDRTFDLVRNAMRKTVLEGTARRLNIDGCEIYGKTGTAQNPRGEDHAWFVSFGGGDLSGMCLVVVVEHGGMGSSAAGPVSRAVWDKYIEITRSQKAAAGGEK